ncbi:MAG TPA: hypothetical protein HA326_09290 [Thermoplasmata archaeon]|nr:hypothetical protein [Thermoplasmata archaeon]
MGWSLLRLWAVGACAVSALLLLFMAYLIPLPFVVPQDYSDRVAVSAVALAVLFLGVIGFVAIALIQRSAWRRDRGVSLALQAAGAAMALLAYLGTGIGA